MLRIRTPVELRDTLRSEDILQRCPWLWAFNHIWADGIAGEFGSLHQLTEEVLQAKLEDLDWYEIMFRLTRSGVHVAHRIDPEKARTSGLTVAQLVYQEAGLLDPERDRIEEIVIAGSGQIDRTTQYAIFLPPESVAGNLVSLILRSA